jgi:nicotinamidase-related amidase
MPIDLTELVAPNRTALVLTEMKRLTVGDLSGTNSPSSPGAPLAAAGREFGIVENVARLARAARAVGVTVVHTTSAFRPDGVGTLPTAPILVSALRHREHLLVGSPGAEPALELYETGDIWQVRFHGLAPFIGTELDPLLRSLGVETIVLAGGSLNVGIPATAAAAVDFGFRVVIPRDAVVGVPHEFTDLVFEHQLRYLAWLTSVDAVVDEWSSPAAITP